MYASTDFMGQRRSIHGEESRTYTTSHKYLNVLVDL